MNGTIPWTNAGTVEPFSLSPRTLTVGNQYGNGDGCWIAKRNWTVDYTADCTDAARWSPGTGATEGTYSPPVPTVSGLTPAPLVRYTATGATSFYHDPATALNLTGKYILLRWYQFHPQPANTQYGSYSIRLYDVSGNKWSDGLVFESASAYANQCDNGVGLHTAVIPVAAIPVNTLPAGHEFETISRIRIENNVQASDSFDVAPFLLQVVTCTVHQCAIRIDWNSSTQYDNLLSVATYATAHGVPLTIGVGMGTYGSAVCPLLPQIQHIQQLGHEIVVYGGGVVSSKWNELTPSRKFEYFRKLRALLEALDIPWNGVFFEAGGSGNCAWDWPNIIQPGIVTCLSGQGTMPSTASVGYVRLPGLRTAHWSGFIDQMPNGNAPTYLSGIISQCETNGGAVILGSHVGLANDVNSLKASIDLFEASTLTKTTFGGMLGL